MARFDPPAIADAIHSGVVRAAEAIDLEQAVYGLDALDELSLHPVLADALRAAGYGVFQEQHYPEAQGRRRRSESEGDRCDLVLTLEGRELATPGKLPTLFDPPDAVPLDAAFWLEVKVVTQHTTEGPNSRYASQLLSHVRGDVRKLSRDPGIRHGGLLIVLFAADENVAAHDLDAWLARCLDHNLPVGSPGVRTLRITNRLGNAVCAVGVFPVWHE